MNCIHGRREARCCRTWLRIAHCSIPIVVTIPEVVTLAMGTFQRPLGRLDFRVFPQFDDVATLRRLSVTRQLLSQSLC